MDLVIINDEEYSYNDKLRNLIEYEIQNNQIAYMINNGIFILSNIEKEDLETLEFRANLIIDVSKGNLDTIIKEQRQEYFEHQKYWSLNSKDIVIKEEESSGKISKTNFLENLKFCNEYGGFTQDGKEYHIAISKKQKTPVVWSNILGNRNFGTVVTETAGGYTWCKNSRLNRITAWNNNAILDMPSEIIYVKDVETEDYWTLGYSVVPKDIEYNIIYGFGYVLYKQIYDEILQENQIFVPTEDNVKVNYINVRNLSNKPKKLKILYYIKPVLGEDEIETYSHIYTDFDMENNVVSFKNLGNKFDIDDSEDHSNTNIAYIASSEKILSYTGSKKGFIGVGNIYNPEALNRSGATLLDNQNSIYEEGVIALEIEVELSEYENKEISLILGEENSYEKVVEVKKKYSDIEKVKNELDNTKVYWNSLTNRLQVRTPDEATNIMLNGWNVYQTIVSRLYGRSGYYQSGGAIGFRDQLQDTMGIKYIDKNLLKEQILQCAAHQFKEGDVLHWWHNETKRGIRTRFSDDLLWLPYAILEYVNCTGDYEILQEKVHYLQGEILPEDCDEKYDLYLQSEEEGNVLEHMERALEKGINIGENGFIKIGSGDWNDGFSTVGNKGKGESIWLTFFVCYILELIIQNPKVNVNMDVEKILGELRKSLNNKAWNGEWFKRAITDSGKVLGSPKNEECRIDSIAQSWSIISNTVSADKQVAAFESVEKYLIDFENKVFKLLTPSFDKSNLNPGYIRRYINGVRENGGQYTHGSIWLVWAATILGYNDKAFEYYTMFNPINHSADMAEADKYMVEPYVIVADIYGENNLVGKGGWTWYTGASAWFYKIGIENILGLQIKDDRISIKPSVPSDWNEYKIRYVYGESVYNITVKKSTEDKFIFNGIEIPEKEIKLVDNGKINDVEVRYIL